MSPAAARAPRANAAPAARSAPESRPELRVLPAVPFRAPRGPFVLVVGAVLTLGLLGVLLLNTVVAQDAFTVSALQQKSALLADQEQALTQQVAAADSPQRLEARARALGMVANQNPVFLRLADGKVLGKPVAGKAVRAAAPAHAASVTGKPTTPTAVKTKAASAKTAAKPGTSTAPRTPTAVKTKAATAPTHAPTGGGR